MLDPKFEESVQTLKELQEKFSPQDMLTVIQRSTQLLTEAYEHAMAGKFLLTYNSETVFINLIHLQPMPPSSMRTT